MKNVKTYFLPALLFLSIAFPAGTAVAQANYYNAGDQAAEKAADAEAAVTPPVDDAAPPSRSFTVTSVRKCYERLSREDVLDIQRNYIKPYQECQRRLAIQLKKKQEKKAGAEKDAPAEKSHGFYRVQKEPPEKKKTGDSKAETQP